MKKYVHLAPTEQKIIAALEKFGPLEPVEVARRLNMKRSHIGSLLSSMRMAGRVRKKIVYYVEGEILEFGKGTR